VFSVDTATGQIFHASAEVGTDYDLALSSNQTQFEAASCLYDSDLFGQAPFTMNDREALNISYVYGAKFSPDGTLLFQPDANGMDIFDGRLGTLRTRIAFPFALSQNYDALVSNGRDSILLAITGANGDGIAVLDLSSVPEPSPLPYATNRSSQARRSSEAYFAPAASPSAAEGPNPPASASRVGARVIPHLTRSLPLRPR
jgi:hypothetical protein